MLRAVQTAGNSQGHCAWTTLIEKLVHQLIDINNEPLYVFLAIQTKMQYIIVVIKLKEVFQKRVMEYLRTSIKNYIVKQSIKLI